MHKALSACLAFLYLICNLSAQHAAPAYPLILHDPYLSIWSMTDTLNAEPTKHWTGENHALLGMLKVDNMFYRLIGKEEQQFQSLVSTAEDGSYSMRYTETTPGDNWMQPGYNDAEWLKGTAPLSNKKNVNSSAWTARDVWMRRQFDLNALPATEPLFLKMQFDDNVEVFLNGEKIYSFEGVQRRYISVPLDESFRSRLKQKGNLLAVHAVNTRGNSFLDAGLSYTKKQSLPSVLMAAKQTGLSLLPTQTIYHFECGPVTATLTFTSPLLMDDLKLMSTPISYINYSVKSNDGKQHQVKAYFGASTNIAVHHPSQQVSATTYIANNLHIAKAGTVEQPVLQRKGDDVRIDWGHMYVATEQTGDVKQYITPEHFAVGSFMFGLSNTDTTNRQRLFVNTTADLKTVGALPKDVTFMLGYDDIYSIEYFGQHLRPWWNKDGRQSFEKMLNTTAMNEAAVMIRCVSAGLSCVSA